MMNPNMFNSTNIGMNVNPIHFNNKTGINNLTNMGNIFNDINSLKVKNLVQPYEEKIKELEEKLDKKNLK